MAVQTVSLWKVYCTQAGDEGFHEVWSESKPTACPNNNLHSINADSVFLLDTIASNEVVIREEDPPEGHSKTGGHIGIKTLPCSCPPGLSEHKFSWPFPISALAFSFMSDSAMEGDSFELLVGPNTNVTSLSADSAASDSSFVVADVANMFVGMRLNIGDGSKVNDLGVITHIDTANVVVTTDESATDAFSVSSPTVFQGVVTPVSYFEIGPAGSYHIGESKIGGSYTDAGTIISVKYSNNHSSPVTFRPTAEYLY